MNNIKKLVQKELKCYKVFLVFYWVLIVTGITFTVYSLGAYLYFLKRMESVQILIKILLFPEEYEKNLGIIIWHYYLIPVVLGIVTILCGIILLRSLKINHTFALYINKNLKKDFR